MNSTSRKQYGAEWDNYFSGLGGVLLLASIILCMAEQAHFREVLLSRNATYTVTGGGYVYTGQIQPGVNERAKKDGVVLGTLVEPTDSGDALKGR